MEGSQPYNGRGASAEAGSLLAVSAYGWVTRIGSAEIYAIVEGIPEVAEALVIGVEEGEGYYMPLFVALSDGADPDDTRGRIVQAIRAHLSPRHVPDEILIVPGIPHTRTGKKLEVPIKRMLQGQAPASVLDAAAVDAPELIDHFAEFARSRLTGR